MPTTTIPLADGGQIDQIGWLDLGPGVGADGDLGAEAGFGEADGVGGVGVQIVGDELVEAFHGVVGDVEEDGSLFELGAVLD